MREVISAYQKCVAETVQRFGGFLAKYMGDGVLVYFGYPQAHEDDAERAVRAGLDLIQAVGGLRARKRRCSDQRRHLDDVRGAKRVDRRLRVAELGEDLVRVLAEHRCAMSEAARRLGQTHRCRR